MAKGISLYVKGDDAALTARWLKEAGTLFLKLAHTQEAWKTEILNLVGDENIALGAHLLVGGHQLENIGNEILSKMNKAH